MEEVKSVKVGGEWCSTGLGGQDGEQIEVRVIP